MNQKKNKKISIILIILIVLVLFTILLGGFAFAYLTTDIFRSKKDMFFKYVTQIGDSEKGLMDNQLKGYFDKRKNSPYSNEGKFFANIESSTSEEQFKNTNNFNISFSGQVDTANSMTEQDISLNYTDDVNFPFTYKQVENIIGLQTKYVGSKYLAIDIDNSEELTDESPISLNIDTNSINNLEEFELTKEQKEHIKNTYFEILNKELGKDKFSKTEEADTKGYKLSLTGEEFRNITIQLLETLKNDTITLDIILKVQDNSDESEDDIIETIDDCIERINDNTDLENENFEITVYTQKGITNKIVIQTNEIKTTIQKENSSGNIIYKILMETTKDEDIIKISFNITYSGVSSMQNINELYELGIESEELQYKYTLENNINFVDSVNIENLTSDNSMILTDYEPQQVLDFLNLVFERIIQVNKQQMEELGVEENENPIKYLIPSLDMFLTDDEFSTDEYLTNASLFSENEISTFNAKFENYESTNQQAQTVKGLLSTISRSNTEENDYMKITEINFNGEEYEATEEDITTIKENINVEKNYRVEFEKDPDTGLIYRVIINEK